MKVALAQFLVVAAVGILSAYVAEGVRAKTISQLIKVGTAFACIAVVAHWLCRAIDWIEKLLVRG